MSSFSTQMDLMIEDLNYVFGSGNFFIFPIYIVWYSISGMKLDTDNYIEIDEQILWEGLRVIITEVMYEEWSHDARGLGCE